VSVTYRTDKKINLILLFTYFNTVMQSKFLLIFGVLLLGLISLPSQAIADLEPGHTAEIEPSSIPGFFEVTVTDPDGGLVSLLVIEPISGVPTFVTDDSCNESLFTLITESQNIELYFEDCDGNTHSTVISYSPDSDGDGVNDDVDNCPNVPNADQTDTDGDDVGDACDGTPTGDDDGDDVDNSVDNCPNVPNADQTDTDGDDVGDACDGTPTGDDDGDGVDNSIDICYGDDASGDTDNDGTCDDIDPTPTGEPEKKSCEALEKDNPGKAKGKDNAKENNSCSTVVPPGGF
jgi:hypothetical protein